MLSQSLRHSPHKLSPRSTLCIFLGYSDHHKGYRCLDLASNHIIISCHVMFDESSFPFAHLSHQPPSSDFKFLLEFDYFIALIGPCTSGRFGASTAIDGSCRGALAAPVDFSSLVGGI